MAQQLIENGVIPYGEPTPYFGEPMTTISPNHHTPDALKQAHKMLGLVGGPYSGYCRWLVMHAGDIAGVAADIVSTPLFDSKTDRTSLALTAGDGQTVAVQSRPFRLAAQRNPDTGAWPQPLVCDVISQKAMGAVIGTGNVKLIWLDEDYAEVGTPGTAWGGPMTPPTAWTPLTTWQENTPPTAAVYVALRIEWLGGTGAPSGNTCYFREPYLTWKQGDMLSAASDDFAGRYITYV